MSKRAELGEGFAQAPATLVAALVSIIHIAAAPFRDNPSGSRILILIHPHYSLLTWLAGSLTASSLASAATPERASERASERATYPQGQKQASLSTSIPAIPGPQLVSYPNVNKTYKQHKSINGRLRFCCRCRCCCRHLSLRIAGNEFELTFQAQNGGVRYSSGMLRAKLCLMSVTCHQILNDYYHSFCKCSLH